MNNCLVGKNAQPVNDPKSLYSVRERMSLGLTSRETATVFFRQLRGYVLTTSVHREKSFLGNVREALLSGICPHKQHHESFSF